MFFITSFRLQDDEDGGVCCVEDLTEGISVGTTSNVTSCLRSKNMKMRSKEKNFYCIIKLCYKALINKNTSSMYLPILPPVKLLLDSSSEIVGTDGRWGVADPYETKCPVTLS